MENGELGMDISEERRPPAGYGGREAGRRPAQHQHSYPNT